MRNLTAIIVLLLCTAALLTTPGCRDRDNPLSPMGPAGHLKLSVDFALDENAPPENLSPPESADLSAPADKRKAAQSASTVLSAAIGFMDAEVYDGSQGALLSLSSGTLEINWEDSTFSGVLTVEAGQSRVAAVRAYAGGGAVIYLGVKTGIKVVAGQEIEARITMKPYVPVIIQYSQISQTGDITLDWMPVDNATGYIVQESRSPFFSDYDSLVVVGQSMVSMSGRPSGIWYFRVAATGDFAVGQPSDTVSVRVASEPVLTILSPPESGATVQQGETVLFLARVLDEFQGLITDESIAWTSDRDGVFTSGAFALYSSLSLGDHSIAATVQNQFGMVSSDTVGLSVVASGNLAPRVTLEYPSGGSFNRGEIVLFLASGSDPENGELPPENFYWFSSRDGYFGNGNALEYEKLSLGEHMIRVVGRDASGAAGTDSVAFSIVSSGANTAPQVRIITPVEGSVFPPGGFVLLQGLGEDAEEGLLSGEALSWTNTVDGPLGSGEVLVAGNLSLGSHMLFLTAVDAEGAASRDSAAISVAAGANPAPGASITLPPDGSTFQLGTSIRFVAEATGDIEDYVWFSAATGLLATGQVIESSILPLGVNKVYLAAVDTRGAAGLDSVLVNIVASGGNRAPQVAVTSPAAGTLFNSGAPVYLSAEALDPEEGILSGMALSWRSSLDGFLGWGGELFVSTLSRGEHRLTAIAVDALGAAGMDSVDIQVASSGGVESPSARITSPPQGGQYSQGAGILFSAEVSGISEEQAASGRVWWSSDAAGRFGTGVFWIEHGLPLGSQKVYLAAVAETGAAARDSVRIEVLSSGGNRSPLVTVVSPRASSSWPGGSAIPFLGLATDPEEGGLLGESLTWHSSAAGDFGSGEYLVYSSLPEATQWVRLVAVDSWGAAGADSVEITVGAGDGGGGAGNQAPEAGIIYPADGISFASGTPVLFAGTGVDAEEGNLPGERLNWYSSVSGLLGVGDYLVSSNLADGEHRVVLLAADAQGLTGSAEVNIRIEPGANQSPAAAITSPRPGAVFALGTDVEFTGTASDPEDGVLAGSALTWISNLDEVLGTGASLVTDRLSAGKHSIVLLARDSRGAGAFDSVSISLSHPPQVEIISPADGASYPLGTPIEFTGSASDPEDGVLPGSALIWSSSLEEMPIGVGASFVTRSLRLGTHIITLVAGDRMGLADSAAVAIEVVAVPDSVLTSVSVGAAPLQVAVDPAAAVAFLTNSIDNSLSSVDLQSFAETNRVGVGSNPVGLAISRNLGRVYVANSSGDNLSVVEGISVTQTIPVGFQPVGVALNQDESLVFVSNSNAASLSVISTTEGAVVRTIEDVGNSPGDLLVTPAGGLLFVSNYGSSDLSDISNDEVAAIDLLDYSISRIPVGDKPMGLATTSDGSLVFVANSGSNSVSIISTAGLEVVTDVAVGLTPTACAVTPGDNQLYVVSSASGEISVVDIPSKTVIEVIPGVGQQPWDIAIYDDPGTGRVLALVTDRAAGRLVVLLVR